MSSTPKKRPKSQSRTLKIKPNSSPSSLNSIMEPPKSLFPSKDEFIRLITVLAIASLVAVSCSFFADFFGSSPKPFCDSNLDSSDSLPELCEPCPNYGECYQGKLECVHGYRKHGKLCVEDGDINETAKKLSKWVEVGLCESYAQLLCNKTGEIWVPEDDVWKKLDRHELMENLGSDDAIKLYAKRRTMETVATVLETWTNSNGIKQLKCPDLLAEHYKPFTCCIRQWIYKHYLIFVPVFALLVGCALFIWKIHRSRNLATRVEELYCQVCEILEENALTSKSANGDSEPWVVASRLRDHLLLPRERKKPELWKKVEELVQEDSRVDRYPKLVKGESKVVWEWQVEGSLSSSRLRKKGDARKLRISESANMDLEEKHNSIIVDRKPLML